ncbi:MAG: 3-dehydroquinate synthase [Chloroflexota bacterium]|nr:3-dehydroquinate synthase [Chloroflexota bacterium]
MQHVIPAEVIEQVVGVTYRYPVLFTDRLLDPGNTTLREVCAPSGGDRRTKVLVVIDNGIVDAYPNILDQISAWFAAQGDVLELVRESMVVTGGEAVKNEHETVTAIHRAIHEAGIDRHSYVVAVGGGAVLDMAGYAAATAHRGVRLVRVPTTVLAQNDSGVGVKNSVNAFGKKNFLGTFAPPAAVINDQSFLTTLPDREWRGGISEAVKVALLKDVTFFEYIEANAEKLRHRDRDAMQWLIYRCAELHLNHIATSGDPFEFGSSRPLDFGHWSAHKLEQLSNYAWRHGEAVAIGISLDSTYTYLMGMLPEADWRRILDVFIAVGLPIYAPEFTESLAYRGDARSVLSGLDEFREHLGGQLTIMLLEGLGKGVEVNEIDEDVMVRSIARLQKEHDTRIKEDCNGHTNVGNMSPLSEAAHR